MSPQLWFLAAAALGNPPANVPNQTQWWNPKDFDRWYEFSTRYGVRPPGFLDNRKEVPLTMVDGSPAVAGAIQAGGFAFPSQPTRQRLTAALEIVEHARSEGEQSLALATLRIQILAAMERDSMQELRSLLVKLRQKPSPELAFEAALCEKWAKFRSSDRRPKNDSEWPLRQWSAWQPPSGKARLAHTLLVFSSGVSVGSPSVSPLDAAEKLAEPAVMEWAAEMYSGWSIDRRTGEKKMDYQSAPYPFRRPSTDGLFTYLSSWSNGFPKRHRLAYWAFDFASEAGRKTDALRYAKRYVANAPDSSVNKKYIADFVRKNGG